MRSSSSPFSNPSGLVDKRLAPYWNQIEEVRKLLPQIAHVSYYLESLFNLDRNLTLLSDENVDHHILKDITIFQGASAYEIAVAEGFEGTVTEWLASLKGEVGTPGQAGVADQTVLDAIYTDISVLTAASAANEQAVENTNNLFINYALKTELQNLSNTVDQNFLAGQADTATQISNALAGYTNTSQVNALAQSVFDAAIQSRDLAISLVNAAQDSADDLIALLRGDVDGQSVFISNFVAQTDDAVARIGILESASTDYQNRIVTIETANVDFAATQTLLSATQATQSSDITNLQQVSADQSSAIVALQTSNNDNASSITNLQATTADQALSLTALTTRTDNAESAITNLQTTTAGQATSLSQLETRTDTAESNISNLQTTTANQALDLQSLTSRTDTAESNITNLQATTSTQATSLSELTTRTDDAESAINTLNTTTANQATSISTLQTDMGNTESSITNLQTTQGQQATSITNIETDLVDKQNQINAKAAITYVDSAISGVNGAIATTQTNLTAVQNRLTRRMPTDFENLAEEFTWSSTGAPESAPDVSYFMNVDRKAVANFNGQYEALRTKAVYRSVKDAQYGIRVYWRPTGVASGASCIGVGWRALDKDYGYIAARVSAQGIYDGTSNLQVTEATWTGNDTDVWLRPEVYLNGELSSGSLAIEKIEYLGPDQGYTDIVKNKAEYTALIQGNTDDISANLLSLTTLSVNFEKTRKSLLVSDFSSDGLHWTNGFGGVPEAMADPTGATYYDVAGVGRVLRYSSFNKNLTSKSFITPVVGRRYRYTATVRAQTDAVGGTIYVGFNTNGLDESWAHGVPTQLGESVSGFNSSDTNLVASDGWVTIKRDLICTAKGTYDARWRPRLDISRSGGSGGAVDVAFFDVEDVTEVVTNKAEYTAFNQARANDHSALLTSYNNYVTQTDNTLTNFSTLIQGNSDDITAQQVSLTNLSAQTFGAKANLIPNSTGANGLEGWDTSGTWGVNDGVDIGRHISTGTSGFQWAATPFFNVQAGQSFAFQIRAGGYLLSGGYFDIKWYTDAGVFISNDNLASVQTGVGYPTITGTKTAPANAAKGKLVVGGTIGSGGFLILHKAKAEIGTTATQWNDDASLNAAFGELAANKVEYTALIQGNTDDISANLLSFTNYKASVGANNQNLIGNSQFLDSPVGTNWSTVPPRDWSLGGLQANTTVSTLGNGNYTAWSLPGERGIVIAQLDAGTNYQDVYGKTFKTTAGDINLISMYLGTHRCGGELYILYYDGPDGTGNYLGTGTAETWDGITSGMKYAGTTLSEFKRCFRRSTAPANAASGRVLLRKFGTDPGEANSYLFGVRPMLERVTSDQLYPSAWSPAGDEASASELFEVQAAHADDISANALSISSLSTTVDGVSATVTTQGTALADITGRVEATWGVMLDGNGVIVGVKAHTDGTTGSWLFQADTFQVKTASGTKTPFSVSGDTVKMANVEVSNVRVKSGESGETGTILFDNGTVMSVKGLGFGTSNQFIEWVGPSKAANLCDEASAIRYVKTNGDAYFGGSLSAGTIYNAAQTTLLSAGASIIVGPFGSNGNSKTVIYSYNYAKNTDFGGSPPALNDPTATLALERRIDGGSWTTLQTHSVTGSAEDLNGLGGVDYRESMSGSWTTTDTNTSTGNFEYRLRLTARDVDSENYSPNSVVSHSQTLSISSTEE